MRIHATMLLHPVVCCTKAEVLCAPRTVAGQQPGQEAARRALAPPTHTHTHTVQTAPCPSPPGAHALGGPQRPCTQPLRRRKGGAKRCGDAPGQPRTVHQQRALAALHSATRRQRARPRAAAHAPHARTPWACGLHSHTTAAAPPVGALALRRTAGSGWRQQHHRARKAPPARPRVTRTSPSAMPAPAPHGAAAILTRHKMQIAGTR